MKILFIVWSLRRRLNALQRITPYKMLLFTLQHDKYNRTTTKKLDERECHVLGKYQLNFADMCWRRRISRHEISCWSVIVEELFPCVNDVANDEYLVTTNYNCSVSGRVEDWSRKFCLIVTKIHHYHRQAKLRAPPQYSTILSDQTSRHSRHSTCLITTEDHCAGERGWVVL